MENLDQPEQQQQQGRRSTRASELKRKLDAEEVVEEQPKLKIQTIGQYLADEREKQAEQLTKENDLVNEYQNFEVYNKNDVIEAFHVVNVEAFKGQLFRTEPITEETAGKGEKASPQLLFLTLRTDQRPSLCTHWCNNASLRWHIANLNISPKNFSFSLPDVVMLFVRGEHVPGTSLTSDTYKYMGLVGVQSVSSGSKDNNYSADSYIYLDVRLVYDCVLSRNEILQHLGENNLKCKKNKYGCSLCA